MVFYRERIELVKAVDKLLQKPQNYGIEIFYTCLCISGIFVLYAIAMFLRIVEMQDVKECFITAGISPLIGLIVYKEMRRYRKYAKKVYKSTVTLADESIILVDGNDKLIQQIGYADIEWVEVVTMYAPVRLLSRYIDEDKTPIICLHTKYTKIPSGSRTIDYYRKCKQVITFTYNLEAWNILCHKIPQDKLSLWDGKISNAPMRLWNSR